MIIWINEQRRNEPAPTTNIAAVNRVMTAQKYTRHRINCCSYVKWMNAKAEKMCVCSLKKGRRNITKEQKEWTKREPIMRMTVDILLCMGTMARVAKAQRRIARRGAEFIRCVVVCKNVDVCDKTKKKKPESILSIKVVGVLCRVGSVASVFFFWRTCVCLCRSWRLINVRCSVIELVIKSWHRQKREK